MVANILPTDTPLTQGVGLKGQTKYFSESSHVAYQIKADDTGSSIVLFCQPRVEATSCFVYNSYGTYLSSQD